MNKKYNLELTNEEFFIILNTLYNRKYSVDNTELKDKISNLIAIFEKEFLNSFKE